MYEYPTEELTSVAEVAYWQTEDRRHEYAEWVEQQAELADPEADADEEEG